MSTAIKAVLVCHQQPRPTGHGGHRRAYQIRMDLERVLGHEHVVVTDDVWTHYQAPGLRGRARSLLENPLKLVRRTYFTRHLFEFPPFLRHYESLVAGTGVTLSVLEHAGFASLLEINARHGVRTIVCPQNIESFDTALDMRGTLGGYARAIDFANELRVLARCDERLLISKVEAGLLGGLGLPGRFYPYRAVGEVRDRLMAIRLARTRRDADPATFLMLGTAAHESTRASMEWFVGCAREQGLPPGARVIVAGLKTDELLPPGVSVPGLELRGWVEDDALDALLTRATAMLLPQRSGFGALTRLPELACAGIPLLLSRHASLAVDAPPGTAVLDDDWPSWREAMKSPPAPATLDLYEGWDAEQARPLDRLVHPRPDAG